MDRSCLYCKGNRRIAVSHFSCGRRPRKLTIRFYGFTTWFNTGEVLLSDTASPKYLALSGCVPTARVDLVSLATPVFNVAVPIATVPSRNLTLPVGTGPVLVTCAVKVTACPAWEGLGLELRAVLVG